MILIIDKMGNNWTFSMRIVYQAMLILSTNYDQKYSPNQVYTESNLTRCLRYRQPFRVPALQGYIAFSS